METTALPLDRGAVELIDSTPIRRTSTFRPHAAYSTQSLSPRTSTRRQEQQQQLNSPHERQQVLFRRVSSYHDSMRAKLLKGFSRSKRDYGSRLKSDEDGADIDEEAVVMNLRDSFRASSKAPLLSHIDESTSFRERWKQYLSDAVVDLTSGIIAFLLSSTLAVSCASVLVGHGTLLSDYIANFIDMNFLGTAVLCVILAWQSGAPWTLGAIDVFVAPIMASMAQRITIRLEGNEELIVPTTVMMVALTSMMLGLVFFLMGIFRVTSVANYMPYPVIAGFLSGIGAELMKNGIHMAASRAFSLEIFTLQQQLLLLPALCFAAMTRLGKYLQWPVAISFPCLLVVSMVGFHFCAFMLGMTIQDLQEMEWVFAWSEKVIQETPMWYAWAEIDFNAVQWKILLYECFGYIISLLMLGALKYSVATTSLSTLFAREICADNEMRVIGLANIVSGAFGCCGGCHYLSAMGIMKQFNAHEKVPALVCAFFLVSLWMQGIRLLQYVPKFVFGGLIMSVGLHFLEAYFLAPFQFLKRFEKGIVVLITGSFLVIGMLAAVGLGIVISILELIYRIHEVGCVHHETTGALTRSAVDRSPEQSAYLDAHGAAIFVLRLQGYLFFGTSVNIIERIETRVQCLEFPKLEYVIIDFGLVPDFDATALLNFRKATSLAERFVFELYFCGLKPSIGAALRRNPPSQHVHYVDGNVDGALEVCENALLPSELLYHARGTVAEWQRMNQLELWEHFLYGFHHEKEEINKLLPLVAYLDVTTIKQDEELCPIGLQQDIYFICFGFMNVLTDSEFSNDQRLLPGVVLKSMEPVKRKHTSASRIMTEESQWTPFTTAQSRLRKIGPGSIITPESFYRHVATSDCVLLRLRHSAMQTLETKAPLTAIEVYRLMNAHLGSRYLHSNKRVSQLSSLLYK